MKNKKGKIMTIFIVIAVLVIAMVFATKCLGYSFCGINNSMNNSMSKEEITMNKKNNNFTPAFGLGGENTLYGNHFTGKSYFKPLVEAGDPPIRMANVTFSPGCRTNWHVHTATKGGGQIIIIVDGEGWYQEAGKAPVSLKPGMVVNIPPNVKHWHGAKKNSWFAHLSLDVPGEGLDDVWYEPVSEEEYENVTKMDHIMYIKIGDKMITATLEDNETVSALKKFFGESSTLSTDTYGGFERGCILKKSLPTNHSRIAPVPGDIMLHSDNEFMIYFGPNSAYKYTRIGKINDVSEEELKSLLGGRKTIDITFSFKK